MKRVGYIYDDICSLENIHEAIMNSSLGKRDQKRVKAVMQFSGKYAKQIRWLLQNKAYKPSPYIIKTVLDGANKKTREICKPRYYPDQIIHWALMQQIQPLIMHGMYEYNCGSVPGRGTSHGQKMIRRWLDTDRKNTKYCLKMDVTKFYPSVNNEILKSMFRKIIKDDDCLWLIDTIIDSHQGLPIGNYTSQWFANFFLQGLDHFIKEQLGIKYYIRYVDDLVLLGPNKKKLHKARVAIEGYLNSIDLKLKGNWQVFRVDYVDRQGKRKGKDIDFLGFRFYRDMTVLRKRTALRIGRRMKKIRKKGFLNYKDACAVVSYWGWIKRSNSYQFYHKYVKPIVSVGYAKKVVSLHDKKANSLCANSKF